MKHKHHDLIVEWAKDTSRVVQYKWHGIDRWIDDVLPLRWDANVEYRFKPETKAVSSLSMDELVDAYSHDVYHTNSLRSVANAAAAQERKDIIKMLNQIRDSDNQPEDIRKTIVYLIALLEDK